MKLQDLREFHIRLRRSTPHFEKLITPSQKEVYSQRSILPPDFREMPRQPVVSAATGGQPSAPTSASPALTQRETELLRQVRQTQDVINFMARQQHSAPQLPPHAFTREEGELLRRVRQTQDLINFMAQPYQAEQEFSVTLPGQIPRKSRPLETLP